MREGGTRWALAPDWALTAFKPLTLVPFVTGLSVPWAGAGVADRRDSVGTAGAMAQLLSNQTGQQIGLLVGGLPQHLEPSVGLSSRTEGCRRSISAFHVSYTIVAHANLELCLERNSKKESSGLAELTQYKPSPACTQNSEVTRVAHLPQCCSRPASSGQTCLLLLSPAHTHFTLPSPPRFCFPWHSLPSSALLLISIVFIACCLLPIGRLEAAQGQTFPFGLLMCPRHLGQPCHRVDTSCLLLKGRERWEHVRDESGGVISGQVR